MRRFLDRLYLYSGYLAAVFLVGILVVIIWQVVARWLGRTADATEAAGMCLAAATFFGLAHTFRAGSHVRINLLLSHLPRPAQKIVELFNCFVGLAAIGLLSWNMWALSLQSWDFHDVSPGLLAMPFWIPQAGVATGMSFLVIALADEILWILQGGTPRYEAAETEQDTPVA